MQTSAPRPRSTPPVALSAIAKAAGLAEDVTSGRMGQPQWGSQWGSQWVPLAERATRGPREPRPPRSTRAQRRVEQAGQPPAPGATRQGLVARAASRPTAAAGITGVTLDSRTVRPGDLYAALPGANVHGARFVPAAVRSGAVAVLTDPAGASIMALSELSVPVLVVPDPRGVLGEVAATVYGHPSRRLTMLGVTGTNGKTTTTYLLDAALRALHRRTGLIGTVETRIGERRLKSVRTTPESTDLHALFAVMVEDGVDACSMEVSSHALALHRVDGVRYDVAAFTNLSQDHLDFHGTMEAYFAAKAELFTAERCERGVVCVDDEWGRRLAGQAGVPVVTVASSGVAGEEADWVLDVPDPASPDFDLVGATGRLRLRSALPGEFNRVNTAVAALVLVSAGFAPDDVVEALLADPAIPGRMERVGTGAPGLPDAVVDFAHTPTAVSAGLEALRAGTTGRLVAVLGAGGDRDHGKRPAMGAAAAGAADVLVVTDDNPRSEDPAAIRAAVAGGALDVLGDEAEGRLHVVGDRAAAIRLAVSLADPGDVVVVLGKGHETGQEVAGVVHPFDDREVLRAALAERASGGTA